MKNIQKMHSNAKGFTLIELMIVVAIIGILAAIALPAYQDYVQRTKVSGGALAMSSYKTGVALCYAQNGDLESCDSVLSGATVTAEISDLPKTVAADIINYVESAAIVDGVISLVTTGVRTGGVAATPADKMAITFTALIPEGNGPISWNLDGTGCKVDSSGNLENRGIDCSGSVTIVAAP